MTRLILLTILLFVSPAAKATEADMRTLVLRQNQTAAVLDGTFAFTLRRMSGYSVIVEVAGQRRKLKIGQALTPAGAACRIVFQKISPETRIARFRTDCG